MQNAFVLSYRLLPTLLPLVLFTSVVAASAQTVTYTFDGGGYTAGEATPIHHAVPDLNPANTGFTADFGDFASAGTFELFPSGPNGTDLTLTEASPRTEALSISTSLPVTSVNLDWLLNATVASGALVLTDANGGRMVFTDPNAGDVYAGGSLTYTSATPFTSFTLQGYGSLSNSGPEGLQPQYNPNTPTQIDVDNLVFTLAVPEPSTWVLLGPAVMGIGIVAWRRRKAVVWICRMPRY